MLNCIYTQLYNFYKIIFDTYLFYVNWQNAKKFSFITVSLFSQYKMLCINIQMFNRFAQLTKYLGGRINYAVLLYLHIFND